VIGPEPTFQQKLVKAWHAKFSWLWLLLPLSLLFRLIVCIRRIVLQSLFQGRAFSAPVIVVGNISVGGCGKTPLLIAVANQLIAQGLNVAIVSRGYGAKASYYPLQVQSGTSALDCGDEPLLIRHSLAVNNSIVVVDPDRRRGVNYALQHFKCDLVLCDDGLQHYRLHRDIEIAVIDGARGFGNKHCLPVGPLREPVGRLHSVDFVVVNGEHRLAENIDVDAVFHITPLHFRNLSSGEIVGLNDWSDFKTVHAIAAIGNPERFSNTLKSLGFEVILTSYDDHEVMTEPDLTFEDNYPVIITAKDAVKFAATNLDHIWVLEVDVNLPQYFVNDVLSAVNLPHTQS
jgi:tetraacyldisaccharide 4'-kinase